MSEGAKVTPEHIDKMMDRVVYTYDQPPTTNSTFCHAYLDGDFYLASGHSACVSSVNFDAQVGRDIATRNVQAQVRDRLWELEGYRLYCEMVGEPELLSGDGQS